MKLHRVKPGLYQSKNSRVLIKRVISRQTNRPDEVCWDILVDGQSLHFCEDTKREAVVVAEKKCSEMGITAP